MTSLAYSIHLGSDQNRKKSTVKKAKSNISKSTSLPNNAIQNAAQLSKVNNHNLRKYDNNQELISTIYGTNDLYKDVQNVYLNEFEEARIEYNKTKIIDRKIDNYFNHISNNSNRDLACELIIEIGDMEFWKDKDNEYRYKMTDVFKEQIKDLNKIIPEFIIANATIHYDESCPHLHIVGVSIKDGYKNGMKKQVGKSLIFTKTSLANIQDKMREYCINSFNRCYQVNYKLKEKEEGRNRDLKTSEMKNYRKMRKEQEKNAQKLKDANNKTDNLNDKTKVIEDIVNNLKPAPIVKNTHLISSNEIEKISDYIKDVKSTTKSIKSVNNLNYIMDKYEQDINTHENIVNELNNNLNDKDKLINELTDKLNKANENNKKNITEINNLTLQLNNLKRLWRKFIDFLTDKILFKMDKSYIKFVDELFDNKVITEPEKNHIKTGAGLKVKERNNDYER